MINTICDGSAPAQSPPDMVWIPGGTFRMGSADFYLEERPVHDVTVDGFSMDPYEVTNEQFSRFVAEIGHVTVAERRVKPEDVPGAPPENLVPGSMVFQKRTAPVDLRNYVNWWAWVPGASWRHPTGPHGSLGGLALQSRPTRGGPARICRPKPSGSSRRAADSMVPRSRGGTRNFPMARPW
jgi:formylglycine-generating enzyme required for sulfatase activity